MGHLESENITVYSLHIGEIIIWLFKFCKYKPLPGTHVQM